MPIASELRNLLRSGVHRMGELEFQTNVSNHFCIVTHWQDAGRVNEPGLAPLNVATLCSDLIRINTSNPTHHERPAAEYVAGVLDSIGVGYEWFETEAGRTSLVARVPGRESALPPLLVHAHLDVVPAIASDWSVDPFSGEVRDGYVWGRGAVDMKGAIAATLATLSRFHAEMLQPRRDLVLAFFADEEAGGELGAGYVTTSRPDLFADCREAIGEVGGFSRTLPSGSRAYFISTGEKGVIWAKLQATGVAGHGSMLNERNVVSAIGRAVATVADHRFGTHITPTVRLMEELLAPLIGVSLDDRESILGALGPMSRMLRAGIQNTMSPTGLEAGYKINVIPGTASATIDCRYLPGCEDEVREFLGSLTNELVEVHTTYSGDALEVVWEGPLSDHMQRALKSVDSSAVAVPYLSTAFTDAKWLSKLGINCYGFNPLLLPDDLDFTALFHGVDERVPVSGLEFSVSVLHALFEGY